MMTSGFIYQFILRHSPQLFMTQVFAQHSIKTMDQEATVCVGTVRTVKTLYYVSKLFGLAPFQLKTEQITRKVMFDTKLRENVLYKLWSLFLLILMIIKGITRINMTIKRISEGAILVKEFSIIFSYVSSIISLIILNFKRDLVKVISKQLYKIDGNLSECEHQARYLNRSQCVFVTKIYILLFTAIMCMVFSFVTWGEISGYFNETLLWTSNFISLTVLLQVLGFLSYMHHNLTTLNKVILSGVKNRPQKMSSDHTDYNHSVSFKAARVKSRTDYRHKHHISVINTNYSGNLLCGTSLTQRSVSSNVLILRNTYNMIYDLLGIVNSIYGLPILVELTHTFLALVGFSYYFLVLFHPQEPFGTNPFLVFSFIANSGLWLLIYFLKLFIITFTCENLRSENKRLSDTVHKLLLQQDMAADSVHQLQLFSFQLKSCKMEFSAAGFFSVDLPYLYSLIAAMVTYFVVLLQMK
jgi:hypothetical protein